MRVSLEIVVLIELGDDLRGQKCGESDAQAPDKKVAYLLQSKMQPSTTKELSIQPKNLAHINML